MNSTCLPHSPIRRIALLAISGVALVSSVTCGVETKESGAGVYIFQQDGTRYVLIGQRFEKQMGCESSCGLFWKRDGKTITLLNGTAENAEYYVDGGDLIEVKVIAPLEAKSLRRADRVGDIRESPSSKRPFFDVTGVNGNVFRAPSAYHFEEEIDLARM